jgi:PST family polysaccharide transporter
VSVIYRLLAIGGLLQPLYNTQAWLHIAADRSDRVLRWAFVGTPIILVSFAIGLMGGVNGVALAYSLAIVVATPLALGYAGNSAGLNMGKMIAAVARPIGACVLAGPAVWPLRAFLLPQTPGLVLVISSISFICLYGLLLVVAYQGAKPLRDLFALFRLLKYASTNGTGPNGGERHEAT